MWWSVFTLSQKATTAYRPLGSSKRKWTWKERRSSANEYWNFNRDLNWALGLNERPLVPSTDQNVNFLCDLREDAKQKNHKKFPFGKETSVASYYLARITSAITSVFRSPIVFASEVHVEPFQYVRVCKPTSLFLCSYQQKKWDSFHYFPGPQRPGLWSCRILFSEFGTFSLSPESCRCWSEIADYHHIVPILYTNLMDQELRRNKDPWFWRFSSEKKRFSDYTI